MNVKLPVHPEELLETDQEPGNAEGVRALAHPWIKLLHMLNRVAVHTVGCILLLIMIGGAGWLLNEFAFTKGATWFRGTRFELPAETVMQIADSAIFVLFVISGFVTTAAMLWADWKER